MRLVAGGRTVLAVLGLTVLTMGSGMAVVASAETGATGGAGVDPVDSVIWFYAAEGHTNSLVVRQTLVTLNDGGQAAGYVIDDTMPIGVFSDTFPPIVGRGCMHDDPADATRVVCLVDLDESPYVGISLSDGNDLADVELVDGHTAIDGGLGADVLVARAGDVSLYGGVGADALRGGVCHGGAGADVLQDCVEAYGGEGNDALTGAYGAACYGGEGADVLGGCGEADGGEGNDRLTGSIRADVLRGGEGHDVISGGRGNDVIFGNSGNDVLYGNSGNDRISGGPGKDRISGGPGRDTLSGGPGTDSVRQ